MRAIVCREGALRWEEVSDPVPGKGDVVIEVAATSVNRADLLKSPQLH